ncbi:MAG: hypothetical protein FWH18_12580 [Marinilabiliaceae bacterium]|nr:hypothetical protein [Marinilabiliaceae bacterium]
MKNFVTCLCRSTLTLIENRIIYVCALLLLISCNHQIETYILSGILWGGEGNRLIIKSVSNDNYCDTILIDNMGEFVWNPDTLTSGFYYLEKIDGSKLILYLEVGKSQIIDGLYTTFPENIKTPNTDLPLQFLEIENINKKWFDEINDLYNDYQKDDLISDLNQKFDSIKTIYRKQIMEFSEVPLVRMFALMQSAGNNSMFDSWSDRELFFELQPKLKNYFHIKEVRIFLEKTEELHQLEQYYNRTSIGKTIPTLFFEDDTIFATKHLGKPVYLELRNADSEKPQTDFSIFQKMGLEIYVIYIDKTEEKSLSDRLGIIQFPTNFLLNKEGIISAKNIWGEKLYEAIDLALSSGIEKELSD